MAEPNDTASVEKPETTLPKKAYTKPRLIVHGSAKDITSGAKGGNSDIGGLTATGL